MRKKLTLSFVAADAPITAFVTKFGGQPVWKSEPEWPISRETGESMRFICQIALDTELFGEPTGRMAYLFMTDGEEFVDGTYDPDAGENAVIIQPDGNNPPTEARATGPSLYTMKEVAGHELLQPIECEFSINASAGVDPEKEIEDDDTGDIYSEIKIGGTPAFLQGEEYPAGGEWRLLLQLDSSSVPFYVNFGDAGVGYAFISSDGQCGKFLWQCC